MKKFLTALVLFIVVMSSTPLMANNAGNTVNQSLNGQSNNTMNKDEAASIVNRVNEIRNMDRKNLSAAERKALKHELMGMKKKLAEPGAGIYISGTALILIIILLIILL